MNTMSETVIITLVGFAIPFASFVIMFVILIIFNKNTTGEIKYILPPDILLKVMAIILVVIVTFILTYLKILDVAVTAAILGSVVTGTMNIKKKDKKLENKL